MSYNRRVVIVDENDNPVGVTGGALNTSGGGGGGGGAVTIADGADITQGAKADAAATSDTGTFSLISLFKRLLQRLTTLIDPTTGTVSSGSGTITVGGSDQQVFAAPGTTRLWLEVINVSDETLWVDWNGASAVQDQPSVPLLGNGLGVLRFTPRDDGFVPQTAIRIIGATTGKAFTAYQVLA